MSKVAGTPLTGWGYEEIGDVIEIGSEVMDVKVGDRVYGAWDHRTHHIPDDAYAAPRLFPETLEPIIVKCLARYHPMQS